ncbi:MAG: polyprenyl synthetase family protein [Rhizobiales bacterium]|nr:polyprenyl synthetase family protein [Hyphomicrobiales bacterium]MBO6697241.1 polyprenyl synthetase family protein [Hyphomicrobiales bacterium]MBO6736504.1 polyprenyl synthetase family protein [Hyphomicrobiales bacterium]MBO6912974.1 polyprenyl synthetase family protein [Hyphomicrobiales bacterium]MBO6954142.1 polyprenyl synthetase family protein [Hyphomicrobiales bacterium]
MDIKSRIDHALKAAIERAGGPDSPPQLAEAIRYAVFPGGARVRPRLCLAVASACGDDRPELTNAAAASVELLHCASLVHDDMPCFDNADLRRGRPAVHTAYGEPLALLAGDGMIVLAFEILARAAVQAPERLAPLVTTVAGAVGMPHGIVAGQGWESETQVPVDTYHRAKTGALFVGASMAGAVAAGADPAPWRALGDQLGSAYQAADDLRDALCSSQEMGKPAHQDDAHDRPSLVSECGIKDTIGRLEGYVAGAIAAIPDCRGRASLEALIMSEAKRLKPKSLSQAAA